MVKKYLYLSPKKIDIFLLSGTRLNPATKFKIPNFNSYRNDKPPKLSSCDSKAFGTQKNNHNA